MAHRVKLMDYSTFRLNLSVTVSIQNRFFSSRGDLVD